MLIPSIEISYDLTRPVSDVLRRIFMWAIDLGKSNSIELYTILCEAHECYNSGWGRNKAKKGTMSHNWLLHWFWPPVFGSIIKNQCMLVSLCKKLADGGWSLPGVFAQTKSLLKQTKSLTHSCLLTHTRILRAASNSHHPPLPSCDS